MALVLQARDMFLSGLFLVKHDKTDAAWLCLRSLTEIVIRMKWMGSSFSRFCCLAIGEEIAAEKRLRGEKRRRRLKDRALQTVNDRLASFLAAVPKRGAYWDRRRKRFKAPPTLKEMARQAHALGIYSAEFRYVSLYVHSSNRVIHRFVKQDENSERFTFSMTPDPDERISPERFLLSLLFLAAEAARKPAFRSMEPNSDG